MPTGLVHFSAAGSDWRKHGPESSFMLTLKEGVAAEDEARPYRFSCIAFLWVALVAPAIGWAGVAESDKVIRFDISRQRADQALIEFAEQADVTFIFPVEKARNVTANEVLGEFTPKEAIEKLLVGTGLHPNFQTDGALSVSANNRVSEHGETMKKRGLLAGLFAAVLASAASDGKADQAAESQEQATRLEQVIVTAQKRDERLQDVPVPVTALSADALLGSNQLRIQDYYTAVPGLSLTPLRDSPVIVVRGITTGVGTNPTVSIVVDDVPYGSSTANGGGILAADFDPSDLERVEILRGPQGTLYGASSLGGLLKFVTIDPTTSAVSGQVQMGLSDVQSGDELGYNVRGSVNVPLGDALAVRATGFTRRDPGYVDNTRLGSEGEGINRVDVESGRLSALWQPSQDVSLKFSALLQKNEARGSSQVNVRPGFGDLEQDATPGTGWYDRKLEVYAATLNAKLGIAELISASGFSVNTFSDELDFTGGIVVPEDNKTQKFTQEFRFSVPLGERVDGLFGAFYTDEDSRYVQFLDTVDPTTGEFIEELGTLSFPTTYEEYAGFANLTFHVTDRFDLQIGGRQSEIKQTFQNDGTGVLSGTTVPKMGSKESSFTYLLTPQLAVSPDVMLYARFASGYRPGGPNAATSDQYDPDTTRNYEIGVKGDVLNHTLFYDASIYHIDWKDIQISLIDPVTSLGFISNVGRARSRGVEFGLESRPLRGLAIVATIAWADSELTEDFPSTSPAVGRSGDRLPYSSKISGNLSLEQEFAVTSAMSAFVGASVSYVGDRKGAFTTPPFAPQRESFPSYTQWDIRGGIRGGAWTASLFVNNVTDERGILGGGLEALDPTAFWFIQPRTVGLSVAWSFGSPP